MRPMSLVLIGLAACGGPADTDTDTPGAPADALKFMPENNYAYSGEVVIAETEVQARADSTIDWCALTLDLRGRAVTDPTAVDQVLLAEFALSQEELMQKVETNALKQGDSAQQWLLNDPGACTVSMSDFEVIGNTFNPTEAMLENDDTTWLVSVLNTPDNRFDILMSRFVIPKDGATNTTVTLDDASSSLTFEADLHSAPPLEVAAGEVPWLDWSAITTDVNGAPYDTLQGDRLLLGKVDVATVEEAEEIFLRLDEEAELLYYADVYGKTSVDLATAKTRDGAAFDGFTTDGIWFVGVECLSCTSPAPLILSVVEVTE